MKLTAVIILFLFTLVDATRADRCGPDNAQCSLQVSAQQPQHANELELPVLQSPDIVRPVQPGLLLSYTYGCTIHPASYLCKPGSSVQWVRHTAHLKHIFPFHNFW